MQKLTHGTRLLLIMLILLLGSAVEASPQKAPGPETLLLKRVDNPTYGFSIRIPVNAKRYPCTDESRRCNFSHWHRHFYLSITVRRLKAPLSGMADALRSLGVQETRQLAEKRTLANGDLLIVTRPTGKLFQSQKVHYFARGQKGYLQATCTAAPQILSALKTICSSLKTLTSSRQPKRR